MKFEQREIDVYQLSKKIPPYTPCEDSSHGYDMWIQQIDFLRPNDVDRRKVIDHFDCIEVRADTEMLLDFRVKTILKALNGTEVA